MSQLLLPAEFHLKVEKQATPSIRHHITAKQQMKAVTGSHNSSTGKQEYAGHLWI